MKFSFKKKKRPNILKMYNPESPGTIEVQRLFKTLYSKGGAGSGFRSLMITSAMPEEGKSIFVTLLALVAAYANQRALIIDADLRRPVQHKQFLIPPSPGVSDYLLKDAELDEAIQNTGVENLKIIPCGSRVSSPGGLLHANTNALKILFDQCQMHFDVILVDVPPVVPVNDPELIGSMVDGVALIIKSGKTYRELIDRALELLQQANCNLLGLVLNNVTQALPYHYDHKYYHYRPGPVWSE